MGDDDALRERRIVRAVVYMQHVDAIGQAAGIELNRPGPTGGSLNGKSSGVCICLLNQGRRITTA